MTTHSNQVEMTITQYLHVLRARKNVLIALLTVCLIAAIAYTSQLPKIYAASTSINFDFQGGNMFFNEGGASREGSYISTQIDVVSSLAVAQRVVDSLSEAEIERTVEAIKAKQTYIGRAIQRVKGVFYTFIATVSEVFRSDSTNTDVFVEQPLVGQALVQPSANREKYPWLASALQADLSVEGLYGSRFVIIEYASTNPYLAARIANAYADTYLAVNLEMITEPARRTKSWFNDQIGTLREDLERAQEKLTEYQQQQGIVATEEHLDTENRRLDELSSQFNTAQNETRKARAQLTQLERTIASGGSVLTFPAVFDNSVVQRISAELRQLEAKLAEQSSQLGTNHPKYQRTLLEIEEAKSELTDAIGSVVTGIRNSLSLAEERESALETAFAKQKARVLEFKDQRNEILVLQRGVESAQAVYNTALNQLNQSNLRSLVDQTNVNIVDRAMVPGSPSGPNILKNLALGLIAGFSLGIGLVVFLELIDRRVRSHEDIDITLGIPVVAVLERG